MYIYIYIERERERERERAHEQLSIAFSRVREHVTLTNQFEAIDEGKTCI